MAFNSHTPGLVNGDIVDSHASASNGIPLASGRDILDSVDPFDNLICPTEATDPQQCDAGKLDLNPSAVSVEPHNAGITSDGILQSNFGNNGVFQETARSTHEESLRDVDNGDIGGNTKSEKVQGVPSNLQDLEYRLATAERNIADLKGRIASMSTTSKPRRDEEVVAAEDLRAEPAERCVDVVTSISA